jgi:hypothetical protein
MTSTKICLTCGRRIEPRKKWTQTWGEIKYCSSRCRERKRTTNYEDQILALLKERGNGKTICPSEVLPLEKKKDKTEMENVRSSARLLVAKGKIVMTQNGSTVDPSTAKGPIRLKLL